ncbi:HRSL1 enzyme, partial [Cinclus mexicanus]|nr:HRSL1 enzyme [Cinclus mexicanus]
PEPGDLIEIDLPFCQHWALYLGDGYVIHLMPLGPQSFGVEGTTVFSSKAKVMRELLKEVVENHTWRVNNKFDRSHTPRPVEKIILSAEPWVDKEVPYDVIYRNCEHFVTMLRYGEAISGQVS